MWIWHNVGPLKRSPTTLSLPWHLLFWKAYNFSVDDEKKRWWIYWRAPWFNVTHPFGPLGMALTLRQASITVVPGSNSSSWKGASLKSSCSSSSLISSKACTLLWNSALVHLEWHRIQFILHKSILNKKKMQNFYIVWKIEGNKDSLKERKNTDKQLQDAKWMV